MDEAHSMYCYPGTDVLINKLNIRDQVRLEASERKLSGIRLMELKKSPLLNLNWDLTHLKTIHRYIFQDVYPFAGKIRSEQIGKGNFRFASPLYIESEAGRLFNELRNERFLKGMERDVFCNRLAYYFSEINVLHPFREGNGRTEREFLRTLALINGYTLDFETVSQAELLSASECSVVDAEAMLPIMQRAVQ